MRCFSQLNLFLANPNVTHYMRDQCYHYKVIEPHYLMPNVKFLMLKSFSNISDKSMHAKYSINMLSSTNHKLIMKGDKEVTKV